MNRILIAVVAALMMMFGQSAFAKTYEQKLDAVAWVVYCEDNTDMTAAHLVLSTVYNRAKTHSVDKLYKAVSAPRQYHCFKIKPTAKKLASKRFKEIKKMVVKFVTEKECPSTKAKFFYNHKLVKKSALGKMKLAVVKVYGSHTYLV